MKIGLMGCEFSSANKGCEALTYSIISILENILSNNNLEIINFSGTNLGKIPEYFPKIKFCNVKPKLKDLSFKFIREIKKCDYVLDATMGDSFSDIYSEKYFNNLIMHKKIVERFCKNYILLPQTYGPFKTIKSKNKAKGIFKKAYKIYSRDVLSKELLENEFNIKNVELVSDMAFILPYNKEMYKLSNNKKIKIGLNASGLLYKGGFNSSNQFELKVDYKILIDDLLNYYSNNKEYEIHLIPHVIDLKENAYDDDYKICKELSMKYKNVVLAPAFETPIEAKSYISNMDIFIGSRMHSTIAAFSSNVITIPISYSRKFEGMFNSIEYNFVINGRKDDTETAFDKIKEFVNKKDILKEQQKKSIYTINEKKIKFVEDLKNILIKLGDKNEKK